jgi:penicillin-binding protein 1C
MLRAACRRLACLFVLSLLVVYAVQVANGIRLVAPDPTPIVLDRHGAFITQAGLWHGQRVEYGYWITPPPDRVVQLTLALEDRRFRWHPGVDPVAVARAAWQHLTGRGSSGASTLAMQVARMQHPRPRTLWAKAVEAGTAIALTSVYGRDAVLAQYLRLAPYGENTHGIGYAARWFFDRPAADLTWAQAALLASVPQAPALLSVRRPGARLISRAVHALALVGVSEPLDDAGIVPKPRRPDALPLVLRLQRIAQAMPLQAEPLLRSTVDLAMVRWITRVAQNHLAGWRGEGAQQEAIMVTRRGTGEVLALVGALPGPGSAIDFSKSERSPGSTLKPFIYAQALERGLLAPAEVLADLPEGGAGIHNADGAYLGPLLPRQALANSRNVPAAKLVARIGLQDAFANLRQLGLHDLDGSADRYGLAIALGALPTTLERLMSAYAMLAEDGMAQTPTYFAGEKHEKRRAINADVARLIGRFLSDPMARLPSFPRYGSSEFPFAVALKTGTSQGYRDAWTLAWSRDYLVGAWVGRPDGGPMSRLSGGRAAAQLVQAILLRLHHQGRADLLAGEFAAPSGWQQAELCTATGQPGPCAGRLTEWVRPASLRQVAAGPRLQIVQPEPETHVWRNPEVPPALDRLVLKAVADPAVPQIVWLLDGAPIATAPPTQPLLWKMQPGRHRFQVRLPLQDDSSSPLTVVVE